MNRDGSVMQNDKAPQGATCQSPWWRIGFEPMLEHQRSLPMFFEKDGQRRWQQERRPFRAAYGGEGVAVTPLLAR
jgi:hypothetical protein